MRILLAAITCAKDAPEANLVAHLEVLADARRQGCDLALFPEMSLTGSVDPRQQPGRLIATGDDLVRRVVDGTRATHVAASFGIAEASEDGAFISQLHACGGELLGVQRKRHLGEGEEGFSSSDDTVVVDLGGVRIGTIICAESSVTHPWDASTATGAPLVLMSSAPGLHGRRTDDLSWRSGLDWWESAGLADARHHARRLRVWVAMATQAGSTVDEDFPGLAALVDPSGEVVARLPDWHAGTLVVDVPIPDSDLEP